MAQYKCAWSISSYILLSERGLLEFITRHGFHVKKINVCEGKRNQWAVLTIFKVVVNGCDWKTYAEMPEWAAMTAMMMMMKKWEHCSVKACFWRIQMMHYQMLISEVMGVTLFEKVLETSLRARWWKTGSD